MSYNQNGINMLNWFYSSSMPSNPQNNTLTTNFRINNVDISNNYVKIGTNSNISVSQIYNINYYSNSQNIGNLFELNLPVFSGTINLDYKICSPSTNSGLLIQILKSTTLKFNYNVNCSFVIVGGGGGGGNSLQSNAGGGGGAGELITGNIQNYIANNVLTIIIGTGGTATLSGNNSTITYLGSTITANGGGYGGNGKSDSNNVTGSSSGGSGSYSSNQPNVGTTTPQNLPNTSIFQSMTSFKNVGALGNDQNNDSGAGGGGGGAGSAAPYQSDQNSPGPGGDCKLITYGSTNFNLAGGGGGGGRQTGYGSGYGGKGGSGIAGDGGGYLTGYNGFSALDNTGCGGGGAANDTGTGGTGSYGTLIFYILPSGVSI